MKIEKKNLAIGAILLLMFVISLFFDRYIYYFKVGGILDDFFSGITELGNFFIVFVIIGFVLYKKRDLFKAFFYSLLSSNIIGVVLKFIIQRPRPFDQGLFLFGFRDYSFPSSHAISTVIGLMFLDKIYPKFRVVWIILGILILFSRVFLGLHYFSDVIFGGIIAYCTARVMLEWS